jgi:hypothetical protein
MFFILSDRPVLNDDDMNIDFLLWSQLAGGQDVTLADAQFVRARLEQIANTNTHGGYHKSMTSDPDFVSRAIFEWWWHERKHKLRIPPYQPPIKSPSSQHSKNRGLFGQWSGDQPSPSKVIIGLSIVG